MRSTGFFYSCDSHAELLKRRVLFRIRIEFTDGTERLSEGFTCSDKRKVWFDYALLTFRDRWMGEGAQNQSLRNLRSFCCVQIKVVN